MLAAHVVQQAGFDASNAAVVGAEVEAVTALASRVGGRLAASFTEASEYGSAEPLAVLSQSPTDSDVSAAASGGGLSDDVLLDMTDEEEEDWRVLFPPGTKVPVIENPPRTDDGKKKTCKVKKFEYPESYQLSEPAALGRSKPPKAAEVGFTFIGMAIYVEDGLHACKCCEFRQYVSVDIEMQQQQSTKKVPGDKWRKDNPSRQDGVTAHVEDCRWIDGGGRQVGTTTQPPTKEVQKASKEVCPGRRPGDPEYHNSKWEGYFPTSDMWNNLATPALKKVWRERGVLDAECYYHITDMTGWQVDVPSSWKAKWDFIGVIFDVCVGSIEAAKRFQYDASGSVSANENDELEVDWGPKDGPKDSKGQGMA